MKSKSRVGENLAIGSIVFLFAVGLIFGFACLFGWLLMLCLGLFGVKAPFWGCVLGWFLLGLLLNGARSKS